MSASAPPPQLGSPQKKKRGNGCLIGIFVFLGVVIVGALIFAIAMWRALSTPEGKQFMKAAGDSVRMIEEAQNAPGAKEVAHEGGCQQALVVDMKRMSQLVDEFTDGGVEKGTAHLRERTLITCQVGFARTPPACDDLAKVYVSAAHPTDPFRVTVQKQGDTQRVCDRSFEANGDPMTKASPLD